MTSCEEAVKEAFRPIKAITKSVFTLAKVKFVEKGGAEDVSPEEAPRVSWVYLLYQALKGRKRPKAP